MNTSAMTRATSLLLASALLALLPTAQQTKAADPTLKATLQGHTEWVLSVTVSPDGKTLASGGGTTRERELKLWDIATGKATAALKGHTVEVRSVAFSPDGKTLASGEEEDFKSLSSSCGTWPLARKRPDSRGIGAL